MSDTPTIEEVLAAEAAVVLKDNIGAITRLPIQQSSPITVITTQDMEAANYKMLKFICNAGKKLEFGDPEEKKYGWEAHVTLQLTGKILEDAYLGKTPNHFPLGPEAVLAYQKEYFNLIKCLTFVYHYKIRLENFDGVNQTEFLRMGVEESIKDNLSTNRLVAVLYNPRLDEGEREIPCFNWCQIKKLYGNVFRLEILYRSWDATAVWSNIDGLTRYFVDEILAPAGAKLGEIIITGTSTHIYRHNFDYAEKVVGPENSKRLR